MQAMPIRIFLILFLLVLIYPSALPAATERRTALVIGNSAYSSGPLKNPVNDAADMAANLQRLGFTVMLKKNASHQEMEDAIREFGDQLKKGGVGLFFYAGHGVQIGGRNYLLPVGARINRDTDVKFQAVDTEIVLAEMGNAGNNLNIVILDACRDNPFGKSFRTGSRGLAIISDAPKGTLITYSTSPGRVAADGSGRNSPYAESLLRHMNTTGLPIEEVFKKVRRDLGRKTGGQQVPWELSSLEGQFFFLPSSEKIVIDKPELKEVLGKETQKDDMERQSAPTQPPESLSFADLKKKMEERREKESQWVKDFEDAKKMEKESSYMPEKIQVWRQFIASLPDERTAKGDEIRKYASNQIERLERFRAMGKTPPNEIKNDGRFIAYDNGTVLDSHTNLMWAARDNGSKINWQSAKNYCENYRGGGYTDWRMPTQDELAGLYDAGKSRPGANYTSAYTIHVATDLIDITCFFYFASETRGSDAAIFDFSGGSRLWGDGSIGDNSYRALPVRSGK